MLSAVALLVAAWIVPGADVKGFWGAFVAAAVIAVLNAVLPPLIAALRLPFTLVLGFLLVLVADALMLLAADRITDGDLSVDSFWSALGVALVASAVTVVLDVIFGTNDDDTYTLRVIQRIARRSGRARRRPTCPGSSSSRSTGSRCPCCGARCATATRRTWRAGSPRARTA